MAFEKKTWKDRITEYPTRRSLKRTDGSTELVTVSRAEGDVSQEGDAFSAANMNDLENRIADNFGNCSFSVQPDGAYVTYIPEGGADAVTKKLGSGTPQLVQFPYTATDDGVAVGFCVCFAKENCNPAKTSTIAIRDMTTKTDLVTSTSTTLGNITLNIVPGYDVFDIKKGHKYDLIAIQNPPYTKYGALYVIN